MICNTEPAVPADAGGAASFVFYRFWPGAAALCVKHGTHFMKTLVTIFYIIIGLAPVWGAQASKGTNAASSAQPPVELRG